MLEAILPPSLHLLQTPAEAAELLRVCRTTVYALIRDGELRSVKIGRRRLITAEALTDYIASLTNGEQA